MFKRKPGERFIAGAVCAYCGAVDRIVEGAIIEGAIDEGTWPRRCLACGVSEGLSDAVSPAIPTGGAGGNPRRDAPTEQVKLIEPPPRK